MALVVKDRVKETTTSVGTGPVTLLGPSLGYQSFLQIGDGNTTYYTISDPTSGDWEVGVGTYTASGTTLSRTTVLSSSNNGNLVNFGAGTKDVFVTYPSEHTSTAQVGDIGLFSDTPDRPGTWLEPGKYYSKAAYPELAALLGSVADMGTPAAVSQAQIPQIFSTNTTGSNPYITATNGVVTVVVGSNGTIRRTSDGSTWVVVPSGTTSAINEVRYLNGNFVAVGSASNCVTSTDGSAWTVRGITGFTVTYQSVAYGAGKYVAVGNNGTISYSSDLEAWTTVLPLGTTSGFTRVVYANGVFVAVGAAGACLTSTDGVTWVNRTVQTSNFIDVVYANSVFVATTSTGVPWYSADGLTWASTYGDFSTNNNGNYPYITATDGTTSVLVGVTGTIRKTTNGENWYAANSPTTQTLFSVSYLNSNFVAVGNSGAIVTSTDGSNWVLRAVPSTNAFYSVAYGAGRYVAAGASGAVVYSSDLVTWTLASGTGATQFNKIIYGNGLFVAVGTSGTCYTSSDGITWTSRSAGANSFIDVIYANSLFVAVGFNTIYTSSDGITWTVRSTNNCAQVIYANSLFVAVGGTTITTSSDGITWTTRATAPASTITSVTWNGTAFYAVLSINGWYYTSTDGITWTGNTDASFGAFYNVSVISNKTIAFGTNTCVLIAGAARKEVLKNSTWSLLLSAQSAPNPRSIAYNGSNKYVAVGNNSLMDSSDGVTWTARWINALVTLDKVQYVNGNYFAMGASGLFYRSSDGVTWTSTTVGSFSGNAIAYGAGLYVVAGSGGAMWSSPDLITWTSRSAGAQTFNDIIFANSIFVAVGAGNAVYSSTDGTTWTLRTATGTFNRIIYANSLFVAVGNNGAIITSSDGITWNSRTSNVSGTMHDVAWSGSVFCAVGSNSSITTSPDGITWTSRLAPATLLTFMSISWSGTRFVVTCSNVTTVIYSASGVSWATVPTQYSGNFIYSTYAGGKFVAIGNSKIATSFDGVYWTSATNVQLASAGPTTANITMVANNRFFMLGQTTPPFNMASSSDGVTWTPYILSTLPSTLALYACIWNGSNYYIVGQAGYYFTSPDGITWTGNLDASISNFYAAAVISSKVLAFGLTSSVIIAGASRAEVLQSGTWSYSVTAQSAANPRTVAYNGSDQYVVVGANGTILSSADGQNWVGSYSGHTSAFDKVQHVNGNYVAMGNNTYGLNVFTSSNGVTWVPRNVADRNFNAVAYGAGLYAMVGATGGIFTSPNLEDWTSRSAGAQTFNDIIFANSIFVAVGAGNAVYSSTDGITWTLRTATGTFNRIIYANSLFVAVGNSGAVITSSDGITWTARTSTVAVTLNDIAWSGSVFCAVGNNGVIITSPTGVFWTARTPGDTVPILLSIAWSGTRFIVTSSSTALFWYSSDGVTWTRTSTAARAAPLRMAYLGGKFLAAGTSAIQSSTDGLSWTSADQVQYVPTTVSRIYKFGSRYYAATSAGIFQSADGITFSLAGRNTPAGSVVALAYTGADVLAVIGATNGQPQPFYKSTDGVTWAKSSDMGTLTNTGTIPGNIGDLVYANGNYVLSMTTVPAQNLATTIYTSSDGVTWAPRQTPFLSGASAVLASDGTTVAYGSANGTFKSVDGGVTWTTVNNINSGPVVYSNGAWIFANTASFFTSSDLSTFNFVGISLTGQIGGSFYVSGNHIVGVSLNTVTYMNKSANGFAALPLRSIASISFQSSAKEMPVRGTTALFCLSSPPGIVVANLIIEIPLYSYDTSTTFWIPPSNAGAGQKAYIYAGA